VQKLTDMTGQEVNASAIWTLFRTEYLEAAEPMTYVSHHLYEHGSSQRIALTVNLFGQKVSLHGEGNGPIDAMLQALRVRAKLHSYEERSMGQGADATAVAFAELVADGLPGTTFGVGMHQNIVTAPVLAIISAVNRTYAKLEDDDKAAFFGIENVSSVS
jgi:2-isopropylmalate synthase